MKTEKQQLIHDLLDDESRRETILAAGGQILRRRRRWRAARRGLTLLLAMSAAATWLVEKHSSRTSFQAPVASATQPPESVAARSLTDNELLALFPNTPVGLITLPNGKKLLIFPRPGDEARFVTRL